MPASKWVRLKYVQTIALDPAIASVAAHYFRANSLFDPDYTGVGHQPMNFDQVILPYDHYTVYGSKMKVTYMKNVSTASAPGAYGIFLDDNNTLTYTSAEGIIESNQRGSKWKTTSDIEESDRQVSVGWGAKRFFGVNSLSGNNFRAAHGGNPAEDAYFVVWFSNIAGNDPASANFMVEIEYLAKLSEKSHVAQS